MPYNILVSSSSDRSGATTMEGAIIDGSVYAFVSPDTDITSIQFYLNSAATSRIGSATGPYDFKGTSPGGTALAWDTRMINDGQHTIDINIGTTAGRESKKVTFIIRNDDMITCSWEVGEWGPCVGGTQSRTVTLLDNNCGSRPGPKPPTTQLCGLTGPSGPTGPTSGSRGLPKVLLVHNGQTANALAYKAHYDQFGLYEISITEFDLSVNSQNGSADTVQIDGLRNHINTLFLDTEWVILMDESIFRAGNANNFYGHMAVTTSVESGVILYPGGCGGGVIGPIGDNPLFDYMGNFPLTDLGTRGVSLLSWEAFTNNENNFKQVASGQWGTLITSGNRGQFYRKTELLAVENIALPTGFTNLFKDNTSEQIGPVYWEDEFRDQTIAPGPGPMLTYITGNWIMNHEASNGYVPGGIWSNLTSHGGSLNDLQPTYQPTGQEDINILDRFQHGYAGAEGTIREPAVCGQGPEYDLKAQFIDPERLTNRYFTGMSIQQMMHSSIEKTALTLIMGDPLFIPYDAGYTGPPPINGCTDIIADNYDPTATVDDGSCSYSTLNTPDIIWGTFLSNYTDPDAPYFFPFPESILQDTFGPFLFGLVPNILPWPQGMVIDNYNYQVPCFIPGIVEIYLEGTTLDNVGKQLCSATTGQRIMHNGTDYVLNDINGVILEVVLETLPNFFDGQLMILLPYPLDINNLFGPNPWIGNYHRIIFRADYSPQPQVL